MMIRHKNDDGVCVYLSSKGRQLVFIFIFFFNDTATTEIYTLSLHDALPILFSSCVENVQ